MIIHVSQSFIVSPKHPVDDDTQIKLPLPPWFPVVPLFPTITWFFPFSPWGVLSFPFPHGSLVFPFSPPGFPLVFISPGLPNSLGNFFFSVPGIISQRI